MMIKLKTNTTYDRKRWFFLLFLRSLYIRNQKNFFRKSYIVNYPIYNFFLKSFQLYNFNYLNKHYINNNFNFHLLNPSFIYSKQFLSNYTYFNDFLNKNNFKGFYLTKNFLQKTNYYNYYFFWKNNLHGNNYLLLNNKISQNSLISESLKEEYFNTFQLKKSFIGASQEINFNFFFLFNIYLFQIIELYKILIYLNLNNIK